jgi:phosphohistidine phosphatase
MELILWRHADAEDPIGISDEERALTKKGLRQAARMAEWLRPRLEGDWRVLVSTARRARETLEALGMPGEVTKEVGTGADSTRVLRAAGWPEGGRVLVVGHQPTLGEVAGVLMGGHGGVSVRKGAVWWFATRVRDGDEGTILRAVMNPEMLEGG